VPIFSIGPLLKRGEKVAGLPNWPGTGSSATELMESNLGERRRKVKKELKRGQCRKDLIQIQDTGISCLIIVRQIGRGKGYNNFTAKD